MDLVVDANILISSLISSHGKTFELMLNDNFSLIAPEFIFEEVEKYKEDILKKSNLSEDEFNLFLSIISSRINIIPYEELKSL